MLCCPFLAPFRPSKRVAGNRGQIAKRRRPVQMDELAKRSLLDGAKLSRRLLPKHPCGLGIPKRPNHDFIVYRYSINCKTVDRDMPDRAPVGSAPPPGVVGYAGASDFMRRYVILTNRKRVIIALVHTVAFLLLAVYTGTLLVRPLHAGSPASGWIIAGSTSPSPQRCWRWPRSAAMPSSGSTSALHHQRRVRVGPADFWVMAGISAAVYVRVAMLACAVAMGAVILREISAAGARPISLRPFATGEKMSR